MNKKETYRQLVQQVEGLVAEESDLIANLANTAAAVYHKLARVNWAGFYLWREGELVLGPFQGQPACIRIEKGNGVCGTAVEEKKTLVVPDVHQFPGHIACDPASQSEIVVPIIVEGTVKGVLDIDSPEKNRFTEADRKFLEEIVEILIAASDWTVL